MIPAPSRLAPAPPPSLSAAQILTQRLAALDFTVDSHACQDRQELIILNVTAARSCLTLTGSGHARWHYEPRTGPASDTATLAAIILHILAVPHAAASIPRVHTYRAFPLKGAVGRYVQDRGLTVTLQVSEDLESFEATTDIEITSPAQPWLGTVRLSDNGHIEWECGYRAAFHGDPSKLIDAIAPILRAGTGVESRRGVRHPGEPEVHRVSGVRPPPPGPPGPGRAVALVTVTGAPRDHRPANMGRCPGHRG